MAAQKRSYGCTYGCGNPYDFIVITIDSKEFLALCTPCFIQTAAQMLEAMQNPDNPEIVKMLAEAGDAEPQSQFDDTVPKRGHNAPVGTVDPDAIEAFESFVLPDELPDGFK